THDFTREDSGEAPTQRFELAERDARALIRTLDEGLPGAPARMLFQQRVRIGVRACHLRRDTAPPATAPSRSRCPRCDTVPTHSTCGGVSTMPRIVAGAGLLLA